MQDPAHPPGAPSLRLWSTRTRRWIAFGAGLLVICLLVGLLYSQRHQLHQWLKALTIPPARPVQITPLALPSGTATPTQLTSADWTTYHQNNARTGDVATAPDPTSLTRLWSQPLDGAVYGEPLVVGTEVMVATEGDSLYALSAQTGHILWRTNVGRPVPLADLPCGDIDPLGITGTPVFDPQTSLVFAVAEIQGPAHVLVGLDVTTGQVKVRRLVDPPSGDPRAMQQRPALALSDGMVYVSFGGLAGDCGDYRGTLEASRTDGTGPLLVYQVPTPREGAIWAPSGPVVDAHGNLYVSVGNGAATRGTWDHSDSVLKLSPNLQLEDAFAPQSWAHDNANDLDLGSLGVVVLPGGRLFIQGKSSQGYLLQASHLGGIGGQVQMVSVCAAGAYGGAAAQGSAAFIPCADGVREIQLGAGGEVSTGWRAPGQVTGSPIIGGQTIYCLAPSQGTLYALDAATGTVRATIAVGTASRFATPSLSGTTLYVGTLAGIAAVQIND